MVKGRFADLILKGTKTTTIRLGEVVPKYDEIIIHGGGRPIAKAKITSVKVKRIKELTEEDAKKDGYSSLEELLKDLERVYSRKILPDDVVTIIEFRVIQRFTDLNPDDVYLGLSPVDIARLGLRYLGKELGDDERRILHAVLRFQSIRTASIKLFGTLNMRWKIRRVLRKVLFRLIEKGLLKVDKKKLSELLKLRGYRSLENLIMEKENES
ncbi:MAG: ASCH domain-containing protein [Thermoprotei archaeon]|nr:MAG: ASCH domain-containing protein [Thermoprotei archaeon]